MKNQIQSFTPQLGVVISQIIQEFKKFSNDEVAFYALTNEMKKGRIARLFAVIKGVERTDFTALELSISKVMSYAPYAGLFARVGVYFGYKQDVEAIAHNEAVLAQKKAEKEAKKEDQTVIVHEQNQAQDVPKETKTKKTKKVKSAE